MSLWQGACGAPVGGSVEAEARLRFQVYTVFVALALPNMLVFGTLAAWRGDGLLTGLVVASAVGLVTGWLRLRSGIDDRLVYRVNAFVFAALELYMLGVGGDDGSKSLWLYVYPLIVIFLLGGREGGVWALLLLAAVTGALWSPGPWDVHPYPASFKVRLVVMYVVITAATLGFEYSRRRYHDALVAEQQKLRDEHTKLLDALAQVKTLTGLVPICANCHRIRDDQGFWNQLETYLKEHSDATFSHGICPACMQTLYPDFQAGSPER